MKYLKAAIIRTILLITGVSTLYSQTEVRFLTFNVWQEGTSVPNGVNKILDIIENVEPDVITFTEVRNYNGVDWTTTIVNALNNRGLSYHRGYAGGDVSLISKYPILSSRLLISGEGSVAAFGLEIEGDTIYALSAHLDYTFYACYLPRGYNGGSPNWNMIDDGNNNPDPVTDSLEVLDYNLRSQRDEQVQSAIDFLGTIEDNPVILMGDFNEPSHLDWTPNTRDQFDHNGTVIPWHNSLTLQANGFVDSYRDFFPNEVSHPGFTWPSFAHEKGSTSWTPRADERDRIDFILYRGENISTTYAALVGPKESYVNNAVSDANTENENFLADELPWPSDHKGVAVDLSLPIGTVNIQELQKPSIVYGSINTNVFRLELSSQEKFVDLSNTRGNKILFKASPANGLWNIKIDAPPGIYFLSTRSHEGVKVITLLNR